MTALTRSEVERRLPIIDLIRDYELRTRVRDVAQHFPAYFWHAPVAPRETSGLYGEYTLGERGLWIHVGMCATVLEALLKTAWRREVIPSPQEADYARAAVALHAGWRYGDEWEPGTAVATGYATRTARVAERYDVALPACRAVAAHRGVWGDGPQPETAVERLVHQAIVVASRPCVTPDVYQPARELLDAHEELPVCGTDAAANEIRYQSRLIEW